RLSGSASGTCSTWVAAGGAEGREWFADSTVVASGGGSVVARRASGELAGVVLSSMVTQALSTRSANSCSHGETFRVAFPRCSRHGAGLGEQLRRVGAQAQLPRIRKVVRGVDVRAQGR